MHFYTRIDPLLARTNNTYLEEGAGMEQQIGVPWTEMGSNKHAWEVSREV